jgi:hypothetical protein
LQRALLQQQEAAKKHKLNDSTSAADNTTTDNSIAADKDEDTDQTTVGGHVRLGWSMRTGDLQAPVGYDKWSFAIRDTARSILHASLRQDVWCGQAFGPGDVVGCAILLHRNNNATIKNTNNNASINNNSTNNSTIAEKAKTGTQTQQQQAQAKSTAPLELSGDQGQ